MSAPLALRPEEYRPAPPPADVRERFGIAIVGCGQIVRSAHLPAYRAFGYRVLACYDVVPERAVALQREFGIPTVARHLDEILERPDIQVIDLAVPATERLPLVARIAAAGKHILSQKPLAMSVAEAEEIVRLCARAGVTLMVNQQARWAPAHRALRMLIARGVFGHLYSLVHLNRGNQDRPGTWYVSLPHFTIVDHGIHYIDLARFFSGRTPVRVKATTTMVPGQVAVSPMIYTILGEYAPEAHLMTTLHFNNIVPAEGLYGYTWYVDGTAAAAVATHTEITLAHRDDPIARHTLTIHGRWFPDAFGGSMGEMLLALAEGREPQTSGRDHLASLRVAFAAVESAETGRTVSLDQISAAGG